MQLYALFIKKLFLLSTFCFFLFLPMKTSLDSIAFIILILSGACLIWHNFKFTKIDLISSFAFILSLIFYISSLSGTGDFSLLKVHKDILKIVTVFLIFRHINFDEQEILHYIVIPLCISSIALLALGIYKFFILHVGNRFHLFTNINRSSIYSLLTLTFLLPFAFEQKKYHILILITIISLFATIMLLGSRTAIVLTFSLFLVYLLFFNKKLSIKKIAFILGSIFVLSIIVYYYNFDLLSHKLSNITTEPYRPKIWLAALDTFINAHHWFLGIGSGQFMTIDLSPYNIPNFASHIGSAHNLFIELLVENGIAGLICYLLLLYFISLKILRNQNILLRNIGILCMIAHLGTSMTETSLMREHGILLFTIFALCSQNFQGQVIHKEHEC